MLYPEDFTKVEPLRQGSAGRAVRLLQARLGLPQTGVFSTSTEVAVHAWQEKHGLVADGIYGPATNRAMTSRSYRNVAALVNFLGVELNVLQTVLKVETNGAGFLDNGLPKILLERHKVWRMSTDKQREQLDETVCSETPGGYLGGSREWGRYTQVAAVIGEAAAAACCSWGLPQIMGSNYDACGAATVDAFVSAMCRDEDSQLSLWSFFLQNNPAMLTALKTKDWATFAARYNGPANVPVYSAKLAGAYGELTA